MPGIEQRAHIDRTHSIERRRECLHRSVVDRFEHGVPHVAGRRSQDRREPLPHERVFVFAHRRKECLRLSIRNLHVARCIREDDSGDALRMSRRILGDDRSAVRVANDDEALQTKGVGDSLDIAGHRYNGVIAVRGNFRLPHAAKIERHGPPGPAQMIELRAPLCEVCAVTVDEKDGNRVAAAAVVNVQPPLRPADKRRMHMRAGGEKKNESELRNAKAVRHRHRNSGASPRANPRRTSPASHPRAQSPALPRKRRRTPALR